MNQPHQSTPDFTTIEDLPALLAATRALKQRIKLQEAVLRNEVKSLPTESIKAGMGKMIPGPLAGIALTAGTALAGSFLTKRAASAMVGRAGWSIAKTGIAAVAPVLLKFFLGKKKKSV